jgi:hypothetical protein
MRWESSEWMVDKVETTPVETVFEAEAPRKVRIESAALSTHIVVNVSEDGFFESGPLRTRMGMMPLPARPDDKVQKISVPLRIVPLGIENARNHATLSVECYRYWNREKAEIASARLREISKRKKWSWREIMRLVQQGGDVQALNEKGYSILHHAAIHGHSDDIPYLVWRGANVNAGDDSEGVRIVIQASRRRATPLSSAITKGHPKAVEALIAAGANVNYRVADTPVLNLAAEKGVLSIVKALINAGAKVNAQVGSPRYRRTLGASALYEAARNGHADIVKFLLDSSANPNASISIYSSPTSVLLGACTRSRDAKTEVQKQGYIETVKLLIKAGADVNFRTRKKGAHDTAISNTYGTSVDNDGRLYNPKPHTGASKAIYVLLKEAGAR